MVAFDCHVYYRLTLCQSKMSIFQLHGPVLYQQYFNLTSLTVRIMKLFMVL